MIIKNGIIVSSNNVYNGDILIRDGKIDTIGRDIDDPNHEVIDAKNCYVFPGGVDVHTHFNLKSGQIWSSDNFETGTLAAMIGGTTTIIDHMGFGPDGCNLQYQLDAYHKMAKDKCHIDYSFHSVIQRVDDEILCEMDNIKKQGITSFKGYMTYDNKINDYEILKLLKKSKELNCVAAFHCENDNIVIGERTYYKNQNKLTPIYHCKSRPPIAESEAIRRLLKLAREAGDAPVYIVHLSTKDGLEEIKECKKRGQKNIYVETCTQYLILDENKYRSNFGERYIMSPPLRKLEDIEALWSGLREGYIDVIATDHCSFNIEDKFVGKENFLNCPNGGPGVEERFISIYSEAVSKGRLNLNEFTKLISTNPADIYGLKGRKGDIDIGYDGDIVILNPNKKTIFRDDNIYSNSKHSIYNNYEFEGYIEYVIQKGNILCKDRKVYNRNLNGEFLER